MMKLQPGQSYEGTAIAVPWGPRAGGKHANLVVLTLAAALVLAVAAIATVGRLSSGAGTTGPAASSSYALAELGIHDALVELSASANPVAWAGHPTKAHPDVSRDGSVAYWATPGTCDGTARCEAAWSIVARSSTGGAPFTASGRVIVRATDDPGAVSFVYDATTP